MQQAAGWPGNMVHDTPLAFRTRVQVHAGVLAQAADMVLALALAAQQRGAVAPGVRRRKVRAAAVDAAADLLDRLAAGARRALGSLQVPANAQACIWAQLNKSGGHNRRV